MLPLNVTMRCTAYCIAGSYALHDLLNFLQKHGRATLYRDVIYTEMILSGESVGDVFYFPYGTVVCWGLSHEEEQQILAMSRPFAVDPLPTEEFDELTFVNGPTFKIHQDEITLPSTSMMIKLAISYGVAQSVKLTIFENAIQETIQKTRPLTESLVKYGKISLSRNEIARKIGELFIARNSINLHTDILDTPEFFWEYSELEPFYRSAVHYLDVATRVDVLNKRLNIVKELFEMLGDQLNHQHSSFLEWIIILLIVMEVIIAIAKDLFHFI